MTFPKGDVRHDNVDPHQRPPTIASKPITRLKVKQTSRGDVGHVVQKVLGYTPQQLEF